MIELIMYFGMGFLLAALSGLVVVPLVHGRAVRLTVRRLEGAIPLSMAEILADKDLLRAEFAMSTRRLEINVEQLRTKSASQLVELGKKNDAMNRLKIEVNALRDQLRTTEREVAVKSTAVYEAEHALSDRKLELQKLAGEPDEPSMLADAQKIEIIALKTRVETLKLQLDGANHELKAGEERRDAERIELEVATQKMTEERGNFDKFRRRVAELVQQLVTQAVEDKNLGCRARDLENRLIEQSRQLNEKEIELKHLHSEIEITRKAEANLRIATIEIEGNASSDIQELKAEKEKLQAALDRANGERMRLAYDLANMKRHADSGRQPAESFMSALQ